MKHLKQLSALDLLIEARKHFRFQVNIANFLGVSERNISYWKSINFITPVHRLKLERKIIKFRKEMI